MKRTLCYLSIVIGIGYFDCSSDNSILIEPIDSEFNAKMLTNSGLDSRLFSTTERLQYYQVSNFNQLSSTDLQAALNQFVSEKYAVTDVRKFDRLTAFFYEKKNFTDYREGAYESARDNDMGELIDQDNNLLSKIYFVKTGEDDGQLIRHSIVYNVSVILLNNTDTICVE